MSKAEESHICYEIVYLSPAQRDLQRLMDFLTAYEVSQARAQEILQGTVEKISVLAKNPFLGFPIGGKYGFETPYRGLICGSYIAVYEPINATNRAGARIEVRRICHEREDYLSQLKQE